MEETGICYHNYEPKNKAEMRKAFNNIIVKGFQQDEAKVSDEAYIADRKAYVENLFAPFGKIKSVFVSKVNKKREEVPDKLFAFVCFENPETADKAVEVMNEKEIDDNKLYVSEALKKSQLAKEIFKFKNSKKRCNLFVKGFPQNVTEDQLKNFFEGIAGVDSIEKIKLEKDKNDETKAKYAFVCFKSPDLANTVKQQISQNPNLNIGGQRIFINNYEPKEIRMLQQMEARDRADYANAISSVGGQLENVDQLFQKPELVQTLMFIMQHLQSQGGQRRPGQQRQQQGFPMQQNRGYQGQQNQPRPMGRPVPQMPAQPNPAQMPMNMPPQPMGQMPMGMHPGMPMPAQNTPAAAFMNTCKPIIPGVTEANENAKDTVGEKIYEFVVAIAGDQYAPKITGMLIDLPYEEIREYLGDFSKFERKVQQAKTLLTSQGQ